MASIALSRADEEVREVALDRLGRQPDISAAALRRHVETKCAGRTIPLIKTFERLVKEYRETAPEPWDLASAPANELRPMVAVIAEIANDRFLSTRTPSRSEASWVARLMAAAPDIPPALAFSLSVRAVRDPDVVPDLTRLLAFAPWSDEGRRLAEAIGSGRASRRLAMLSGNMHIEAVPAGSARMP
jgi:hypothetical protein